MKNSQLRTRTFVKIVIRCSTAALFFQPGQRRIPNTDLQASVAREVVFSEAADRGYFEIHDGKLDVTFLIIGLYIQVSH